MVQPKVARTMFGYNAGPMTKLNRNGYYGANYNPSIFSMPYSPARYAPQMPMPSYNCSGSGTNFWQVLGGLASLAAIALPFMMLFKSFGGNSTGNGNTVEETKPEENNTALTGLDEAVNKANKEGDWTPVATELNTAKTTLATKTAEIEKCDADIKTAKGEIDSFKNEVDKLEGDNKDIKDNQIPALEKKAEGEIKDCDTSIAQLESQLKSATDPTKKAEIQADIDKYKTTKEKIKKALETSKLQLEDKIKQNNTKIGEKKGKISEATKRIEAKTKEKATLDKEKTKLEAKIKEIEEEYKKHTDKVEIPTVDPLTSTPETPTIDGTETSLPVIRDFAASPYYNKSLSETVRPLDNRDIQPGKRSGNKANSSSTEILYNGETNPYQTYGEPEDDNPYRRGFGK